MIRIGRESLTIIFLDLLLALFSFELIHYFMVLPQWHWLMLSAVVWNMVGTLFGKLRFGEYKRVRYAFIGIVFINVISVFILFLAYKFLASNAVYHKSVLLTGAVITLFEFVFYLIIRKLVYRKIPFFYEPSKTSDVVEVGANHPLDIQQNDNIDVKNIVHLIKEKEDAKEVVSSILGLNVSAKTIVSESADPECVLAHKTQYPSLVVYLQSLNNVRHINTLFAYTNYALPQGGYIAVHCTTSTVRHERIKKETPFGINYLILVLDYLWHRVCPKLGLTKGLYYHITRGRNRSLHRVEVLGRLYRAGFEVEYEEVVNGEFYVLASKHKQPIRSEKTNMGVLIRLKRIGKNGKVIGVYKFRTMYAYSEYLQSYIYNQEGLCKGGKISDDYRVTPMGRFLRRTWLDELPMIINMLKGDMKFVGVRPLSNHYFNLYDNQLQTLRVRTKPGLFPPFYADMPDTLDEIQESERNYLSSYLAHPWFTDWRYFWRAFDNIVFKGKRSK